MSGHEAAAPVDEKFLTPGVMVMLAFMAIGGAFAVARFVYGIGYVSNLTNQYPWGLWVAVDVATGVALAAGGFTTGLIAYVLNREQYHAVIRPALLTAMLGYTFVVLGLLVDIGRYWNITSPVFNHNGNSVLFEVAMCVMIYLHVLYIEFIPIVVERFKGRVALPGFLSGLNNLTEKVLDILDRVLGKLMFLFIIAGIVLSCLHQSSLGTLMLIAPHKVHPLWFTPILPLLFLLSAFAAGYPMVVFESLLVAKSFGRRPEMDVLSPLAKYMPVLMGLYLAVKLGDMIVRGTYVYLLNGTYQTNSFLVELGVGVILPFVLLLFEKVRRSPGLLFFASTLFVLGIVLNRINVFIVSYTPPYKIGGYFPSVGEIFVTVGLIATLMFLYRVFVFIFPVLGTEPKRMIVASIILVPLVLVGLSGGPAQAQTGQAPDMRTMKKATPSLADAPRLLMLDSPVIRELGDDYEPVRFMHRKHAGVVKDCAVCHHRQPREAGDDYGEPMTMGRMRERGELPVACDQCHGAPFDAQKLNTPGLKGAYHLLCINCHQEADQTPHTRGPVMYSALARGPEVRPLDTRAPTDCLACHAKNVPDHKDLVKLKDKPDPIEVTKNCLTCHEKEGEAILKTSHWRWRGPSPFTVGHEKRDDLGKWHNTVNNFCINLNGNWPRCTSCHIGYGWKDADFDFTDMTKIDCLVCHDTTGTYKKSPAGAGFPEKEVDLLKVAQNVGRPTRDTCGMNCHFVGGGGDAVKHGDMSSALAKPSKEQDIHMARSDDGMNFRCQDCHKTRNHMISGRSISVPAVEGDLSCEYCHTDRPHQSDKLTDYHLNKHADHVACQTCHIPAFAKTTPTKVYWDWSTAGQDIKPKTDENGRPDYDKKKGSFKWAKGARPEYRWYNGTVERHILGDRINTEGPTELTRPVGEINDPTARIYPFKVHRGKQPADAVLGYLLAPKLWKGFWGHWDWNKAAQEGMKDAGLDYSGEYKFVETVMYWGLTHEVAPKEKSLSCAACHDSLNKAPHCGRCHKGADNIDFGKMATLGQGAGTGFLDFKALGYPGDPVELGGRFSDLPLKAGEPGEKAAAAAQQ